MTTGALKMYFRELPEPLFTYALFHDFVGAISESRAFCTKPEPPGSAEVQEGVRNLLQPGSSPPGSNISRNINDPPEKQSIFADMMKDN